MSNLTSIVNAICAMSVSPVSLVLRGASLKNAVHIADTPVRIVSVIGMQSGRTKTATLGGSGHVMTAEWTITDIALLRAAGTGMGLSDIAADMEAYLAAYHNAVKTLVNPQWYVTNLQCRAQVLEWGQATGRFFDAVTATLTVHEINQ